MFLTGKPEIMGLFGDPLCLRLGLGSTGSLRFNATQIFEAGIAKADEYSAPILAWIPLYRC